jgi:hypothetical protein
VKAAPVSGLEHVAGVYQLFDDSLNRAQRRAACLGNVPVGGGCQFWLTQYREQNFLAAGAECSKRVAVGLRARRRLIWSS